MAEYRRRADRVGTDVRRGRMTIIINTAPFTRQDQIFWSTGVWTRTIRPRCCMTQKKTLIRSREFLFRQDIMTLNNISFVESICKSHVL